MNAHQQHMLDAYRSAQRGEMPPPLPGRHDWEAIGGIRDQLRTGCGRPPTGRGTSRTGRPDPGGRRYGWLRRLLSPSARH
ncbi:hypothetical protein [Streptomyces sp. NPDC059398]|uniref:hypothetical protein n=1 Tax=Streptomyces sp. NPDC059398 TaxID=3346820 RepID=UPI0036CDA0E6